MNPYAVLGVKAEATTDEIKKAYRLMARKYHPDVNKDDPNANDKFIRITAAYELLTNGQCYAAEPETEEEGYSTYTSQEYQPTNNFDEIWLIISAISISIIWMCLVFLYQCNLSFYLWLHSHILTIFLVGTILFSCRKVIFSIDALIVGIFILIIAITSWPEIHQSILNIQYQISEIQNLILNVSNIY